MLRSFHLRVSAALFAFLVFTANADPAPTKGLAGDGAEDLLKTAFLEAIKRIMPGGEIVANTSEWAIDPLVEASTTQGTRQDKVEAWLKALVKTGVTAAWPAYGIQIAGGKIILGGAVFTVESMIEATHDQQVQAILTGKGSGGVLDREDNPAADTPFMKLPLVVNQGITFENVGVKVKNEEKLNELWRAYGVQLKSLYGKRNAQLILDEAWPGLLRVWKAQRAELALAQMTERLDRAMARAQKKVEAEGGTGQAGATTGISGTWHLVCCSARYKMDVTLKQDDSGRITGSFADGSTVTGTASGGSVRFHRAFGGGKQDYIMSVNGNVMTGTFTGDRDTSVGVETTMTRD